MDAASRTEFEAIYAALKEQSPAPETFLERAQYNATRASQAREFVLYDLLIRDDDPDELG